MSKKPPGQAKKEPPKMELLSPIQQVNPQYLPVVGIITATPIVSMRYNLRDEGWVTLPGPYGNTYTFSEAIVLEEGDNQLIIEATNSGNPSPSTLTATIRLLTLADVIEDQVFLQWLQDEHSVSTIQDLLELDGLNIGVQISSLGGIEHFRNIIDITFNGWSVDGGITLSDLSPLAGLDNLRILHLYAMPNLTSLESVPMPKLERFSANELNGLTSLALLATATLLEELTLVQLPNVAASEYAVLSNFPNLTRLYLWYSDLLQNALEIAIDAIYPNAASLGAKECHVVLNDNPGLAAVAGSLSGSSNPAFAGPNDGTFAGGTRSAQLNDLTAAGCYIFVLGQ